MERDQIKYHDLPFLENNLERLKNELNSHPEYPNCVTYDNLLGQKSYAIFKANAASVRDLYSIGKLFHDLHYRDSANLAVECEKQAQIIRESVYDRLVKDYQALEKKDYFRINCKYDALASEYDLLASDFTSIGIYREAKDYALKCVEKAENYREMSRSEIYDRAVKNFHALPIALFNELESDKRRRITLPPTKGYSGYTSRTISMSDYRIMLLNSIVNKSNELTTLFESMPQYKDADNYAKKCAEIETTYRPKKQEAEAEREKRKQRSENIIGSLKRVSLLTIAQLGVLGYYLFTLVTNPSGNLVLFIFCTLAIGLLDFFKTKNRRVGLGFCFLVLVFIGTVFSIIINNWTLDLTLLFIIMLPSLWLTLRSK